MKLMVELDGVTVPLADCDYVLWKPCGCPRGVSVARLDVVTEDDAWKSFFPTKRERERVQRQGHRMELMTHTRYLAEVYELMRAKCPHGQQAIGEVS